MRGLLLVMLLGSFLLRDVSSYTQQERKKPLVTSEDERINLLATQLCAILEQKQQAGHHRYLKHAYYAWKMLLGCLEFCYLVLKIALVAGLILIMWYLLSQLSQWLPSWWKSGVIPHITVTRQQGIPLPLPCGSPSGSGGSQHSSGGSPRGSGSGSPSNLNAATSDLFPSLNDAAPPSKITDLAKISLRYDKKLFDRVAEQLAYAKSIGLDPLPLPPDAPVGPVQSPRGLRRLIDELIPEQIAYALSIGLQSTRPDDRT